MKTKLIASSIAALFTLSATAQEVRYARVVSVTPIETVQQFNEPRQTCNRVSVPVYQDVPVQVLVDNPVVVHTQTNPAAPVLGMLIGAAIGNRAFSGDARLAGTFLGAAVGTAVGENSSRTTYVTSQPTYVTQYRREVTTQYRDDCRVWHQTINRTVVTGYSVTYMLDGVTKNVVMNSRPGDHVRIITSTFVE